MDSPGFFFSLPKPGIFSVAVGVGHVVKDGVIGSACPGLGSNSVRHAAFATNKTAQADGNNYMFSSCNGKDTGEFRRTCPGRNEKIINPRQRCTD